LRKRESHPFDDDAEKVQREDWERQVSKLVVPKRKKIPREPATGKV